MIHTKNNDNFNDITIAGADLFTDSESFFNELTDSEMAQIVGGKKDKHKHKPAHSSQASNLSLLLCSGDVI